MIAIQQSLEKGLDARRALIYFFVAYCVVTVLATATSLTYEVSVTANLELGVRYDLRQ